MSLYSKQVADHDRCGHVDKMSTRGLSLKNCEKLSDLLSQQILTLCSFIYIGRSLLGYAMWTFRPHFVHTGSPVNANTAKDAPHG